MTIFKQRRTLKPFVFAGQEVFYKKTMESPETKDWRDSVIGEFLQAWFDRVFR